MKSKRFLSFILLSLFISACNKDTDPPGEVPPPAPVTHKLKDVIVQGLPSPYYHFEYNNEGDISKASYASGLRM